MTSAADAPSREPSSSQPLNAGDARAGSSACPGAIQEASVATSTICLPSEKGSSPPPRQAQPKTALLRPAAVARAETARPSPRQQLSFSGLRRTNTAAAANSVFDPTIWESEDSGSETSSSDSYDDATKQPVSANAFRRFAIGNKHHRSKGKVSKRDGRLNIRMNETGTKGYLAKSLEATLRHNHDRVNAGSQAPKRNPRLRLVHTGTSSNIHTVQSLGPYVPEKIPKLAIVIMVIGSRGDIQPFLRLGKSLKEYGHRVRIATHPAFREFVEQDSQLEFFSVGGDPAELMAFMVKNPGLIPKAATIREGEIAKRREAMYEMFQGFWRACINTTDDEHDVANLKMMGKKNPFIADAIIANPPSFAHVHCAERLGIPLHLMFTFPTSPTQQFPHPLASIKQSNVNRNYTNFMSYPLVEMMTWQGLGDLVNRFRVRSLGLEPISTLWAPGQVFRMRVPHSYLWSPALIPKPSDWGSEIQITGFVFLDLASSFQPSVELTEFLKAGEPPIYIGFGSIVVDDAAKFTSIILEAVKKAGVRALVSKGWGGLGDEKGVPDNVFMLGNTPHDWLFPQVSAVVHHGGAGSTAIGLKCGKPTLVVPFFGDQPFWGAMIAKSGAGAEPIPHKELTSDNLANAIRTLLTAECQAGAKKLADQIASEGDGAKNAVDSFHRALPLRGNHSMRCSILKDRVAVWWLKDTHVRLSALAAEILVQKQKITWSQLRLVRHYDWNDFEGPGEPVTGAGGALLSSVATAAGSLGRTPVVWASTVRDEKRRAKKNREMKQSPLPDSESLSDSPMDWHDPKGGVVKRASLPPANLGEGHLKREFKKGQSMKGKTLSIPNDAPAVDKDTDSEDLNPAADTLHLTSRLASSTARGLGRGGQAIAQAPIDIAVAIAQGFHNAPRLWGDDTVRTPRRISGIRSGLRAAREELVYGVSDGVSGLVHHPYRGFKDEGPLGLLKGIGKGLGGFVLKDLAAIWGVPAYTLKGFEKEIRRNRETSKYIRRARIITGHDDISTVSKDQLREIWEEVLDSWRVVSTAVQQKKELERQGLSGRIFLRRAKKKWKKHGVFENVEQMSQALDAEKEGRDFAQEFRAHRELLDKAQEVQRPRKKPGTKDPLRHSSKSPRPSAEKSGRSSADTAVATETGNQTPITAS